MFDTIKVIWDEVIKDAMLMTLLVLTPFILMKVLGSIRFRPDPSATRFDASIHISEFSGMYILKITGCRRLWEDDYFICIRPSDGTRMKVRDYGSHRRRKWFVKHFSATKNEHCFLITECSKGKHLLSIEIMNKHIQQKLYIPFNAKRKIKENL